MARGPSPGSSPVSGGGDGLPTLPTGEPVLARWFVLVMLGLLPIGLGVTIWAFAAISGPDLPPESRRPPGSAEVTHDRGRATLAQSTDTSPGPGCAAGAAVVGDEGGRAAGVRALSAVCELLDRAELPVVAQGLDRWQRTGGQLRFATFELSGVDSSTRLEDGRLVIELNAKFQFQDATRAAPFVLHELAHVGDGAWPGAQVTAAGELVALEVQAEACDRLVLGDEPPRGCDDARAVVDGTDPLDALVDAGYPR